MKKFEIPLEGYFTRDLFEFWVSIFGEMPDMTPEVFLGAETEHNFNAVYVELRDGNLAGTCGLTISNSLPGLGGLGEVATAPSHERSGIATMLCREASRDFQNGDGQALFLGTTNPSAERLYQRLGWQKINGSNVMVNTVQDASPEEYLVNFFQGTGPAKIRGASPSIRIPIIPLLLVEHDWCVLDVNVRMYSTRYAVQRSCMGIFRRYDQIASDGEGAWFSAVSVDGRIVGLSTARLNASGICIVDGFTLSSRIDDWAELVESAMNWAVTAGDGVLQAVVATIDEEKRSLFESLGFVSTSLGHPLFIENREVSAEIMQLR